MTNKTFNKWLSCTKRGHIWTENEIIYFRKAINGSSSLDMEGINTLLNAVEGKVYRIMPEQSFKGIAWLKNQCFKANGGVRKSCPFQSFERSVIRDFKEFRFVGLYDISDNSYRNYMPIYRCIAKDGSYFDYVAYSFGQVKVITVRSKRQQILTWSNQPEFETVRQGA